jgi:hypothetical protein|tara:strand:+ start:120 stop:809 length:690 start_codon:yes stop_codon:yes gene_type:complete
LRATDLVRWHRAVNEIRYKHNELELLKELADDYGPVFREHVRKYCEDNRIDIEGLQARSNLSTTTEKNQEGDGDKNLLEDSETALESAGEHFVGEEPMVEPIKAESKDVDEMHEIFKKLFKKLAVHLHPDKVENLTDSEKLDRLEMFKEAKQALDEERYFFLLDLSERFKIRLPRNYKQQTRWMKNKVDHLSQEIKSQQSTYNFCYAECETEEERVKLIIMFLKQLYEI